MHALRKFLALCVTSAIVIGCGASRGGTAGSSTGSDSGLGGTTAGDTNGGGTTALVSGIALPEEVSALPPKSPSTVSGQNVRALRGFSGLATALTAASLPAGSDYASVKTVKWVNEQALSRFDILNSIFKSIGQTQYADPANVNAGAYGALVTQVGGGSGGDAQRKTLQTWVITSSMRKDANGADVNVLDIWMDDESGLIRCETKIWQPPTQNADGSYANYGIWTINASLTADGSEYFVASAEVAQDGSSIVKTHSTDGDASNGGPYETRGILRKSGAAGYGKVSFPDYTKCNTQPCANLPTMTVAYVYDAHAVKLELSSAGVTTALVKDRDTVIDLVNRYGLFDDQGNDVARTHHFGFPFRYGANGTSYGYYGAWQGRHQLWANGQQAIPAGATVTRADRPPNVTPETYTASKLYTGVLVKRRYSPASLADIKDVVVNAYDFQSFGLQGDGTAWHRCVTAQQQPGAPYQQPTCETAAFADWASLASSPGTQVNIQSSSGGQSGGMPSQTTLAVAAGGTGLVIAGTSTAFPPVVQTWVNVNVGGPIWIVWDGAAWKKKQVTSVDGQNQPTFGTGVTSYTIPDGREFYLNNMGVNYVVQCTSGTCSVKLETQLVANPANVASFVPASTTFSQQSWGQTASTFQFVTTPADPKFMKLVYATVGTQDQASGAKTGDVVTASQWGLTAIVDGAQVQFNWDYPTQGSCSNCGVQQFLLDGQGQIVQLDDPIRLSSISLVNGAAESHSYALQFDGSWVGGLPDLFSDLNQAGGNVTPAIQAKAVTIPDGTVVTDATDGTKQYVFKQLEVSQYLAATADPGTLDLTAARLLDLSTVPNWAATSIGPVPTGVAIKYSDGQKIQ